MRFIHVLLFVLFLSTIGKLFLKNRVSNQRQWRSKNTKNVTHIKGAYWIKQWFSSIAPLFKMGASLKGKNLLPEGANSFL